MTGIMLRLKGRLGNGLAFSFGKTLFLAGCLVTPAAHAATSAVGTAPGQFSVSPTGAATYQIPIELPPGVNGLKPNLGLHPLDCKVDLILDLARLLV